MIAVLRTFSFWFLRQDRPGWRVRCCSLCEGRLSLTRLHIGFRRTICLHHGGCQGFTRYLFGFLGLFLRLFGLLGRFLGLFGGSILGSLFGGATGIQSVVVHFGGLFDVVGFGGGLRVVRRLTLFLTHGLGGWPRWDGVGRDEIGMVFR